MIRKFFRYFLEQKVLTAETVTKLQLIPHKKHNIVRDQINSCALKVATELQQAGYSAFIVGGAVRDLLLDLKPKDFDIATNATPDEVRTIFRRSRIIGRRFQLVHVTCGSVIVEVSTFRGPLPSDTSGAENTIKHTDPHGRLLHDNVFGSQEEDAIRRDFTINALFYDPTSEKIFDFLNGFNDIKEKKLRIIGSPERRYREDPVRMLRAVRLAAKLNMQLDPATAAPIGDLAPLLQNVPPARLFDEMLKLLFSGHALACVIDLRARGLHHGLLPMLDMILEQPLGERFITLALKNTDLRIQQNKPVSPGFLFASLLWHEILTAWKRHLTTEKKLMPALHMAIDEILTIQHKKLAIPRRFDVVIKEIWTMQPRFETRSGTKPFHLLTNPRFRAAYDFMLLRCESGELDKNIGEWWKALVNADAEKRKAMLVKNGEQIKRRKRRNRRKATSTDLTSARTMTGAEK
jgi:poly(A) polymerase